MRVKVPNSSSCILIEQKNHLKQPLFKPLIRNNQLRHKSIPTPAIQTQTHSSIKSVIIPLQRKLQPQHSLQQLGDLLGKSEEETKVCEFEPSDIEPRSAWKQQLAEYRQEITQYITNREDQYHIDNQCLRNNKMISLKLRTYLVRHLFKMYMKFQLSRNTLHLAVFYLDLYFSQAPLLKNQFQGVAAAQACLFIAMKFQEIYPPPLGDWVDRRHRQDVLIFEAAILKSLDYQLAHYTVQHQISLVLWERGQQSNQQISLLADLSLFDLNIRQMKHSELAEAIINSADSQPGYNQKDVLAVKWMIQRNAEILHWLCEIKYHNLRCKML